MSRHARGSHRRRLPTWLACLLAVAVTSAGVIAGVQLSKGKGVVSSGSTPAITADSAATQPVGHHEDRFIDRPYVAPAGVVGEAGSVGKLVIDSIGVTALVDETRVVNGTLAIPNDIGQVGWDGGSAQRSDVAGASVIAGHVANNANTPGALFALGKVKSGDTIDWYGAHGEVSHFVVTKVATYPRTEGVPLSTFTTTGPHILNVITCANRVLVGGVWRHLDNLVVTASAVPAP